mgnify:CR=1 FL=1
MHIRDTPLWHFGERVVVSIGSRLGLPVRFSEIWTISVYEGDSPFRLRPAAGVRHPVLTARHVTDVPARFVADPFWVFEGGEWFLFMEVLNARTGQGAIGLATSADGRKWRYRQIVIEEPFHQSYPCVFRAGADWYMTPSGLHGGGVKLYRAVDFPHRWEVVGDLILGPYADPTIVFHDGAWYMFVGVEFSCLRLFTAPALEGPWTEHPSSPLRERDHVYARPAGRIVNVDGRLYRFAQDCRFRYGVMVRPVEITRLSPTEYAERPIEEPILGPGEGWNRGGMHHVDAHRLPDGRWVAVVDGWRVNPVWGLTD